VAPVLAHQGGWDEILLVVAPIALVGWLLWLAKRRLNRAERDRPSEALDAGAHGGQSAD
jgi:hypothetical protein